MSNVKKEQLEFAKKKAEEISSKKTDNIHLAEERGQSVDDKNMDSEDRYSGVLRKSEVVTSTTTTNSTSSSSEKKQSKDEKTGKLKSKLNPNAAEWKPSFKIPPARPPVSQFPTPMMQPPHNMYMHPHQQYPHQMYGVPHGMMMPQYPRGRPG